MVSGDLDEYARCCGMAHASMNYPCFLCSAHRGELLGAALHDMSWPIRTNMHVIRAATLRCRIVSVDSRNEFDELVRNSKPRYKSAGRVMLRDAAGLKRGDRIEPGGLLFDNFEVVGVGNSRSSGSSSSS